MLAETKTLDTLDAQPSIHLVADAPPVTIPPGHVGPVVLPGSGRLIYWTGRVAIGLRHERERHYEQIGQSALWLQDLMLKKDTRLAA
jgi:hypothetical protein